MQEHIKRTSRQSKYFAPAMIMAMTSLGVVTTLAGTLEPPSTAVNGSGDPTATTQMQPSWDQDLPTNERFKLVMGGEAVLGKNTGLVWERSPLTTGRTWSSARSQCTSRTVGGQKGWRLPSIHELASLVDPDNPGGNPDLPAGHPFNNFQGFDDNFWSATTNADNPTRAWSVSFDDGAVLANTDKAIAIFAWCVRGGGPLSEY